MNAQEIKAGQTWHGKHVAKTAEIKHISGGYVFYVVCQNGSINYANGTDEVDFIEEYYFIPEPKTRPIAKDDIIKMLAVNPVVFFGVPLSDTWYQITAPSTFLRNNEVSIFCYSHNPFAANPVIVGPKIEVVE